MRNKTNLLSILLCLLLGVASLLQMAHSLNDYTRLLRQPLWRMRNQTSFERSAYIFLGDRSRDFMDFLDQSLPKKSTVVIAPHSGWFSQQNVLQFYLGADRAIVGATGISWTGIAACCNRKSLFPRSANFLYPPKLWARTFFLIKKTSMDFGVCILLAGTSPRRNRRIRVSRSTQSRFLLGSCGCTGDWDIGLFAALACFQSLQWV